MSETNEGISCPKDNSKRNYTIEKNEIMERRPKKYPS
jgi:hypothetical protein